MLFFKITAAAITGPAIAPLPTSSTPAIKFQSFRIAFIHLLLLQLKFFLILNQIQMCISSKSFEATLIDIGLQFL